MYNIGIMDQYKCHIYVCEYICTYKEILKNSRMSLVKSHIHFPYYPEKKSKLFHSESNLAKDSLNYFHILI